jgi:hypothetical protein
LVSLSQKNSILTLVKGSQSKFLSSLDLKVTH